MIKEAIVKIVNKENLTYEEAGTRGQTPLQNFYEHVKAYAKGSGTIWAE